VKSSHIVSFNWKLGLMPTAWPQYLAPLELSVERMLGIAAPRTGGIWPNENNEN
jgi:hypothetical protein